MGFEFRPDGDLASRRGRDELIDQLVATYGLELRLVQELFAAAERASLEDPHGRSAVHWFKQLAGLSTDVGMPAPGRRTAVQRAYGTSGQATIGKTAGVSPGKRTRTMALAAELARVAQQTSKPEPLESSTRTRMSELLGVDFSQVQVYPSSDEATGSIRAIAKGDEIHFREGAYQPGTQEGDRLIAHELAHLVQQRPGRGHQAPRRELEREADWAASLVARGEPARVRLRAAAGAYTYSDAEDHDVRAEPSATEESGLEGGESREPTESNEDAERGKAEALEARAEQDTEQRSNADQGQGEAERKGAGEDATTDQTPPDQAAAAEVAPERDESGVETSSNGSPAGQGAPAASDADAGADSDGGGDLRGELQEVGEPVAAESGGGGAVSAAGGGGPAPKPVKEAPNVAGASPEAAFGQLRGVRPDKLAGSLPELKTAASADVDRARAKAQANPPKQLSTGESAAPIKKGERPDAEADEKGGPAPAPRGAEQPIKPKLPDERAAKQAAQAEATQAQKTAGQAIQGAGQASTAHFQSIPSGKAAQGDADKMSDADAQAMAGSIDRLSADVSSVNTDPGPPPTIEMKGEAKSSADRDRADLEGKTQRAETQAKADSRVPMGEDNIETTVPTEELTAQAVKGQVPDVPLPTVVGMASSEEVGIIAQEQHQAEIDAALGKASGDVAGERTKHEQADAQARLDTDRQIGELKTQADGEQEGARRVARAEVDKARGEWQGEVDKKGIEARAKADKTIADGMADVETEEEKANQEAKKHVDEGRKKADEEKKKGEEEAEEAKRKGEEKSSGFWGWVKSKAKALVDGIKKAISAVIDTVRKAVKVVIDAAKKLAMAAIELARKAIVAVIQAIGKALLAITDVLLAAFPELKAKFQKAIRGMVDKATSAVNKLAEGLKKAVQKALDLLGAALDKALNLLEKGLHAIVDVAGAVIQAAIKAAEALANMLGVWAKLIKDVATSPGSWISKLASAVVDGIKNHLWAALKTAVIDWFQSKVFELLGLGGLILQILLDGGITTQDITEMALQALIVAIPVILITILVEKLVSMIVPAAGAVMAIIEGLIAAWGTVSRIIAAFGAFVAFLLAVKGGRAGLLFAGLLAAAAVVVLDFVANWLIRKLAGPARKVGDKLKKVAEKFKNRRKPKRPGAKDGPAAKDRDGDKADGPAARPTRKPDDSPNARSTRKSDDGTARPRSDKDGPEAPGPRRRAHDDGPGPHRRSHEDRPARSRSDKDEPDGKPRKRDDDDSGDAAAARRAAQAAAQRGWRGAQSRVRNHVARQGEVSATIEGGHPPGVRANLQLTAGGWHVHATARKGPHTAAANAGHGSVLHDRAGGAWLAAENLSGFNRQLVREIAGKLQSQANQTEGELEAAYQAKKSLAVRLEHEGQAHLNSRIAGLRLLIEMESFRGVEKDRQIATRVVVTPNTEEYALQLPLSVPPGLQPVRDELAKLMGRQYQLADRIELRVREIARRHRATIQIRPFQRPGVPGRDQRVEFAKSGETYECFIQFQSSTAECPSCQLPAATNPPESEPHFFAAEGPMRDAITHTASGPPFAGHPAFTRLQAEVGQFIGGGSALTIRGVDQRQCRDCENRHGSQSIVQRVTSSAASPTATDRDVGSQAGGLGLSETEAVKLARLRLNQYLLPAIERRLVQWGATPEMAAKFLWHLRREIWRRPSPTRGRGPIR